ncbi:oxidoreductase [Mesorhizobium sp. L-8-10]|uniref:Gfo/Idh/MocA family protein n=1 Tax=Mesorhizobium sp. L-8-10 TaxID=2744523 RepID=UPI00192610D1|nr:Gfo/Idh/MocA family oxidoreductase [Mesorhizobium sp. L-8-10]BCH28399.1 oxidoreductase [Mesorhizobium sp. L-8-10]
MKKRIGIVGLGMAVSPHARGVMDLSDRVEVAHAFSPSVARRQAFGERFPFPLCDKLETILDDPGVDAVLVLTPPNTHLDIVRRCAVAGKHVLLEKPVEISTARAEELVGLCRDAGVTLGIVLQHRFRPSAMELAGILSSGELGAIVGCSAIIRLWRPQSYYDEPGRGSFSRDGGGVLLTQGIHTLDLMLRLAGPVAEVTGFVGTTPVHNMEAEDMVCAAIRFANGAFGTIDATTSAYPGFPERIDLTCSKGSASLAGTALTVAFQDGRKVEIAPDGTMGGSGTDPMAFPHDYHRAVMSDFIEVIASGREPQVTGKEALRVHRLIDALVAAGRERMPVALMP